MKKSATLCTFLFCWQALALPNYYDNLPNDPQHLKENLFKIIQTNNQNFVGYKKAREYLFGSLFLHGQSLPTYSITTAYCQKDITNADLNPNDPLFPMNIPDFTVLNAEHTWPQSQFSKQFATEVQKSDLHILLPELASVNSLRSNYPHGEVLKVKESPCPGAALGKNKQNKTVFEPHDLVKGNVARALFYFSVHYKMPLDPEREALLRQWHQQDPVDLQEALHNEQVYQIQKNRNPFIDAPEWVQQISDF